MKKKHAIILGLECQEEFDKACDEYDAAVSLLSDMHSELTFATMGGTGMYDNREQAAYYHDQVTWAEDAEERLATAREELNAAKRKYALAVEAAARAEGLVADLQDTFEAMEEVDWEVPRAEQSLEDAVAIFIQILAISEGIPEVRRIVDRARADFTTNLAGTETMNGLIGKIGELFIEQLNYRPDSGVAVVVCD